MRPEKAHRTIRNAVESYCYQMKLDKTKIYNPDVLLAIDKLIQKDIQWYKDHPEYGVNVDNRSGYETYKYVNQESIDNNMMYISDRFNAQFRLQWLKDGIIHKEF